MKIRPLLTVFALAGVLSLPADAQWRDETVRLDLPTGSLEVEIVPEGSRPLEFDRVGGSDRWVTPDDTRELIGRNYRIELRNRTSERLKVVVAVDGVNVYWKRPIDGDARDTGSVLPRADRRVIGGFQVDGFTAERFVFSPGDWSEGADFEPGSVGTIEVQVYRERLQWRDLRERGRSDRVPHGEASRAPGEPPVGTTGGDDFDNEVRRVRFDARTTRPEARALIVYGRRGYGGGGHHGDGIRLGIRGQDTRAGLRVLHVFPGTVADEVGLREGDLITRVDQDRRPTVNGLQRLLDRKRPGDSLFLDLERGPHELSIRLRLDR